MAVDPFLGTKAQRAFIATITIQAIAVLAMVGITFRLVDDEVDFDQSRYKTLPCYLALFALAEVFEFIMAIDALRLRSVIQLFGILIFHVTLLVFAAIQVTQTHMALTGLTDCDATVSYALCDGTLYRKVSPYLIVAPSVIGSSLIVLVLCFRALYAEFGWAIFHVVGANPQMKRMYQWYQIMLCLLKFDFFCFTGVTMQLLIVVLSSNSAEFAITIAAIPIVLVLLAFCGIAVQREIKWLMTASLALMFAALSYLYKLVRFYQPESQSQYEGTRATLTFFTSVAFILLLTTFGVGVRCFSDFDSGLRESKLSDLPTGRRFASNSSAGRIDMSEGEPFTPGSGRGPRILIE